MKSRHLMLKGTVVLAALVLPISTQAQEPVKLFERTDNMRSVLPSEREKARRFDTELLGIVRFRTEALRPSSRDVPEYKDVVLNFTEVLDTIDPSMGLGNIGVRVNFERVFGDADGAQWVGELPGVPESAINLSNLNGVAAGTIWLPSALIKIRRISSNDLYVIEKINPRRFPNEARHHNALIPKESDPSWPDIQKKMDVCENAPDVKTIRVLLAYTEEAVVAHDSEASLRANLSNIVGEANLAIKNSLIRVHFEIAGFVKAEVTRNPKDWEFRSNLKNNELIEAFRSSHPANIVSLFDVLENRDGYGYCGTGITFNNPISYSKRYWGYNIVDINCAWDNLSWIHEIGHNMGAHHDHLHAGPALFPYSRGMQWPGQFRTIMAEKCDPATPCDRIPRFTNPAIKFRGVTLSEETDPEPDWVDLRPNNARTINRSRCFVAGWK